MKERVITLRKWNDPQITTFVTREEIGSKMEIDEYLESLVAQLTNIPLVFTKATLLEKLTTAHKAVANEMKVATKFIM